MVDVYLWNSVIINRNISRIGSWTWEMEMKKKKVSDDLWNVKPELLAGGGVLGANQHADILQL